MLRRMFLGGIAMSAVLVTVGCAPSASSPTETLDEIKAAVLASSSEIADTGVSSGVSGVERYISVGITLSGTELDPAVLSAALAAVGETTPEDVPVIRFSAVSSEGSLLALDPAISTLGIDAVHLTSPRRARLYTAALRSFAAED